MSTCHVTCIHVCYDVCDFCVSSYHHDLKKGFNVDGLVAEIERQVNELPRGEMTAEALTHSFAIIVDDMKSAVDFSNEYAPEHLIINVDVEEVMFRCLFFDFFGVVVLSR